jgi:hypothetical protein
VPYRHHAGRSRLGDYLETGTTTDVMHGNGRTKHSRGIRATEDRPREILDFAHDVAGTPLAVGQRIAAPRPITDDNSDGGTGTGHKSAPVTHCEFASRLVVIR